MKIHSKEKKKKTQINAVIYIYDKTIANHNQLYTTNTYVHIRIQSKSLLHKYYLKTT